MAVKFPEPVEFPDAPGGEPTPGATLSQVEASIATIVDDLEPPIDLTLLFENALV